MSEGTAGISDPTVGFHNHTHTHTTMHICSIKDTGQRVDPALYGFQHAPLGGHVLLGRHGNTKYTEREKLVER